jgi:hypothetical protein
VTTRSRDTQPPLQRKKRHRRRHARRRHVATGLAASVLLLAAIEFDRLVDNREPLNPGGPFAALGAPPQVSPQSSLTTAAQGTSAQGPVAGPMASDLFAVGPTAIEPSQVSQAHSIPFGPTLGDTIPNPGTTPPTK